MNRDWMKPKKNKVICVLNQVDFISKVKFTCNICNKPIRHAYDSPYFDSEVFSKQNVVGGGFRKDQQCPGCQSIDRLRFSVEVLRKYTDILTKPCTVLEFAPIRGMETYLKRNPECKYITGDIAPGRAQRVLDITKIDFPDATFDYIICCHVLEHIADEKAAVTELMRVLKPNGQILLSVPISLTLQETLEDPSNDTPEKRLIAYGQEDHIRLYGQDFDKRLNNYGLSVKKVVAKEDMPELVTKYKMIPMDHNYICSLNLVK